MHPPAPAFAHLIAPLPPREFLDRFWSTRAVHLRHAGRHFDDYFGWRALDAVLDSADLTYPATLASVEDRPIAAEEFTRDGSAVHAPALAGLFRDGASISIRSADTYWPPLKAIIAALYETFFEKVHTNIYCSPANVQGFRCHYDLHEVFVLQVAGAKHWRVFDPTTAFPVEPWRPEDVPESAPYIDVVLEKGDVLYVPRGHWHYAVAQDSHSLHITAGVTTRKGDTLLEWLRPHLLARPEWRTSLPVLGPATADGTLPSGSGFDRWFDGLRASLIEILANPDVCRQFAQDLFTDTTPAARTTLVAGEQSPPARPGMLLFARPASVRHLITEGPDGQVIVRAAGSEIVLEGPSRELLTRILGPDPFTVADVAPLAGRVTPSELDELLEAFVRAGLLIARPRG